MLLRQTDNCHVPFNVDRGMTNYRNYFFFFLKVLARYCTVYTVRRARPNFGLSHALLRPEFGGFGRGPADSVQYLLKRIKKAATRGKHAQ